MQESNTVEEFLNEYRELEKNVKYRYNVEPNKDGTSIFVLKSKREFKAYKYEIDLFKNARDLLSHEPKINGSYPILPSKSLVKMINNLNERIIYPQRVDSIMVNAQNVCSASISDLVRPFLKEMNDKTYTHIPILDDGRVIGVFSENTLLSLISNEEYIIIDESIRFNEKTITSLTPLEKHSTESFRFVSKNTTVFTIREIFREAVENNDRIGLIFVTQSGKQSERIMGIITPWDIPKARD